MTKSNRVGMGMAAAFAGTMALSLAGSTDAVGPAWAQASGKQQRIRISAAGQVINATLADNETARDFVSLLPLTLAMSDLFGREKTAQLPRAISTAGPRSHTYDVGDVILWSPRPSVAIFYRHDGQTIPSPGSILIAKADSGVKALNVPGSVNVTIDRVEE